MSYKGGGGTGGTGGEDPKKITCDWPRNQNFTKKTGEIVIRPNYTMFLCINFTKHCIKPKQIGQDIDTNPEF